MTLAERWRVARPKVAGLHLDSGACSRQSFAVIDAAAQHARHEAEVGGYVAAEAAALVLDAGRAAVSALTGIEPSHVVFTTGSNHALDLLLSSWGEPRTVACLPGEYGPNLAIMAANGFGVRALPADGFGRLVVDDAAASLRADPPALVHLTALASHRGVVQPLGALAEVCRDLGVPLVVDAAQALGHMDCAVGADAIYSSSRKWLAGPRGVGVLAVRPALVERLRPRLPPPEWNLPLSVIERLQHGEANVAARVGFSLAIGEHLAAGPKEVRAALAEVGRMTREALAGVAGWRVVEPLDEPSAITTLEPVDGADPNAIRSWLIAERGIVTTYAEVQRAPFEMKAPVLRLSPHVDTTADELQQFAEALTAASKAGPTRHQRRILIQVTSHPTSDVTSTTDEDSATATLVIAFSSDPIARWFLRDPRRYLTYWPRTIKAMAGSAFGAGTADSISDCCGVALWVPPDAGSDFEALAAIAAEAVAESDQEEVFGFMEQMDEYHITERHWYLPFIGVDATKQGGGLGSALLRHAGARCDRDGLPAYLEASSPRNRRLYAAHGFEELGVIQVGSSPPMWPMVRKPR